MGKVKLMELASVIRSKNAGPFELTLDVFFKSEAIYRRAKERGVISAEFIMGLYGVEPSGVLDVVWFDPVRAAKATIARPVPSGAAADTDVYGAQQHMPLVDAEIEWDTP